MNDKADVMKKDFSRQIEEFKQKIFQSEEHAKEIHRSRISAESEYEKQKALLDQRLEFSDKQLEDLKKKEFELSQEIKNQKKDHISSIKDT